MKINQSSHHKSLNPLDINHSHNSWSGVILINYRLSPIASLGNTQRSTSRHHAGCAQLSRMRCVQEAEEKGSFLVPGPSPLLFPKWKCEVSVVCVSYAAAPP